MVARSSVDIRHPGRFHEVLGIPQGDKIPLSKITRALDSKSGAIRKMAQGARKAKKK